MDPVRRIHDDERRARLGRQHALASPVETVEEVVAAMTCLHATEMANVYLAAAARCGAGREEVAAALYDRRTVVRQLAMRRTVFAFGRDVLPAVWGSASARVAAQQVARLGRDVEAAGIAIDGADWVRGIGADVRRSLAQDGPATTAELRGRLPALDARLVLAEGSRWATEVAVANRVMTAVAADGSVLRGENAGEWRSSRPRWTSASDWLGGPPVASTSDAGYAALVGSWLRTFGPGTEEDVVWWLGGTKAAVRRALTDVAAVQVVLDDGGLGWLRPEDVEPVMAAEPWTALLPVLDPTTMGWKGRGFYLGEHAARLFDRNGNAGTTAWVDGRIVGGWAQAPDGSVELLLIEDVGADARASLQQQAQWWTDWLDGEVVGSVYHSPLTREHRARGAGVGR